MAQWRRYKSYLAISSSRYPLMHSRKLHALIAVVLFFVAANVFAALSGQPVALWHVTLWSVVGVGSYTVLSQLFGFDPHRTRLAPGAPAYLHYVDRWELRLGQATLSMLGGVVVAARLFDSAHFVTAVVSGTLSAWTYFAFRLYAGGYRTRSAVRSTHS